jgi:serine/threonine protein kinase
VSTDLSEGQTFGAYHIVGIVGSGGMGVVYRAEQRSLGRTVALKVIRPETAESGDYRSRFLREARLAASVNHPHIVSVFDVGEYDGRLYLTMQWIDGIELRALIDLPQRLAPDRVARIGSQLASALQAVHDAGFVHRDVKPANVLVRNLGGQDHSYLTDFGIAKMPDAQDHLTRTGLAIGTAGYMSPEQIRGQQPGPMSDLYGLGCVVFEALTGQRPFSGENDLAVQWAHANSPRPVASATCPALGPGYDAFLARALAVDPHDRFQSGREFAAALRSAHVRQLDTETQLPATPAPTRVSFRPSSQPPPVSTLAAGLRSSNGPEPAIGPGAPGPTAPPARTADSTPAAMASRGTVHEGTRPPPAAVRARPHRAGRAGQLVVMVSSVVFIAAATLLTRYTNNGTGWKSLLEATHGDPASPLRAMSFNILIGLAALVFLATIISAGVHRRLPMIVVVVAALALIGYTSYLPSMGGDGLSDYGSSYWISLAAAVAMAFGGGFGAARSDGP